MLSWLTDDMLRICFVLSTIHNIFGFWGHLYFYLIDKYGIFQQYKLYPNRNADTFLVSKAFKQYVIDSFILFPIVAIVIVPYLQKRMSPNSPSLLEFTLHVCFGILVTDFTFYCSHRMLHTKILYKYIHYQHHEFKTVTSVSSEYSNFIESLLNISTVLIGPAIMKSHLYVYITLIILRLWESQDAHSGYEFPFYMSPWVLFRSNRMHYFHHKRNVGSYGMFAFWDDVFGTNKHYYEYERNRKILNSNTGENDNENMKYD